MYSFPILQLCSLKSLNVTFTYSQQHSIESSGNEVEHIQGAIGCLAFPPSVHPFQGKGTNEPKGRLFIQSSSDRILVKT